MPSNPVSDDDTVKDLLRMIARRMGMDLYPVGPTAVAVPTAPIAPAVEPLHDPEDAVENGDLPVQDLRVYSRKAYYYRPAVEIAADVLAKLPSGSRRVFYFLRGQEVSTVRTIQRQTGLERKRIENALTALRAQSVIGVIDIPR